MHGLPAWLVSAGQAATLPPLGLGPDPAQNTGESQCPQCPAGSYCPSPSQRKPCPSSDYCPKGSTSPSSCHALFQASGNVCAAPHPTPSIMPPDLSGQHSAHQHNRMRFCRYMARACVSVELMLAGAVLLIAIVVYKRYKAHSAFVVPTVSQSSSL